MTWKQAFTSSIGRKLVMAITGVSLILLFFIVYIYDFWIPSCFGCLDVIIYNNKKYNNLYGKMIKVFQNLFIVVLYFLGFISLEYHLANGFKSSFKTWGVHNKRYNAMV